ncbi:MAG: PGPGW domain-containing protein [Methylacidiphilales bacterium]|nr:PGPGW domain-containing protein [Candidatus Methylacidiphilales bacterium]
MKFIRRVIISVVGGTVLLIGIVMIVLPGPAILVIPAGLAILALEYAWARLLLRKARRYLPGKGGGQKPKQTPTRPEPE